ncbi:hypothetical protein A2634_02100 [Candidatus Amesbacteria bacterium RIFCSPHIGHO2_01_FULL_48_32]|uniref:Uncharacterized protein n=1 Tax=Candidatus Amesbacteria bacterium RIFCSPLOWO2_01_FULL_48_25 TaxID=1797259 RepID=A0A1F4ZDF7_9BACT|nr:MAG: hypothetical protein A2634_02100 [Candidatus Amesbacteria bacterium RIFCSPHIGHO2_01_FULL_48_32]OGD04380.1 MAG: hypothetical protein A2989_05100 [Candidatus Amesbacteria bacterium RIFCSPLOWO2_01_FULL_48_25]HJZ06217.1 hypothetical protein [Patescibacteria group bacterium]
MADRIANTKPSGLDTTTNPSWSNNPESTIQEYGGYYDCYYHGATEEQIFRVFKNSSLAEVWRRPKENNLEKRPEWTRDLQTKGAPNNKIKVWSETPLPTQIALNIVHDLVTQITHKPPIPQKVSL